MARFFIAPEQVQGSEIIITGEDVNHISKVLRFAVGDQLTLVDGQGLEYIVEIVSQTKSEVKTKILQQFSSNTEAKLKLTLVQGLVKGEKMDWIVQKATELGVHRIIPVATERTIVKVDDKKGNQKVERWQKIAVEASKQCRRSVIPQVAPISSLQEIFSAVPESALAIIPWEEEKSTGLKGALNRGNFPEIFVFIGPEGGFTSLEVEMGKTKGVIPVTLGPRILRAETAAVTVASAVMYHWGELGGC